MEKQRWEESDKRREEEKRREGKGREENRREEKKKEDHRRERVRGKKIQVREKVGKCVFPMICGSGGSKSRLAEAAGAEPCGQMRNEKLHAVVA